MTGVSGKSARPASGREQASAPLLLLLVLPGCPDLGERAGGGCPAGETCSPLTPEGLEFTGPTFGDDWLFADPGVKTTAVGGAQTIGAWDHETGTALEVPYDASVDSGALLVASQTGNEIQIEAVDEGGGELELRDGAGGLMDRIGVGSALVDHVVFRPANGQDWMDPDVERTAAVFDGAADLHLVASLRDADDGALVDDDMFLDSPYGIPTAWDTVALSTVDGDVYIEVTAGAQVRALTIPAVSTIDSVESGWWFGDAHSTLDNGSSDYVCFHSIAGTDEVLGVPWTFAIDGPAVRTTAEGLWRNCLEVSATAVGHVTVSATAPGATGSFEFDVVDGSAKPSRAIRRVGAPTPGERASTVR